ncbi:MAG: hypothetical protein JXX14_09215 [Deltaproteobacteria bacterium]|nr:hypothetical protein [Deltaproteobacteria bacterium]
MQIQDHNKTSIPLASLFFRASINSGGQLNEHDAKEVEAIFSELRDAIGDEFKWEWDGRFNGALTQFDKSNAPLILSRLSQFFMHDWTVTNIENAPEAVLIAADFLGGLRPGQHLLTTAPDADPIHVAAFWPWGNGATISVRIIPFGVEISPGQMAPFIADVRTGFNL